MLRRMAAVSWDVHELLSQHNHYVDELLVVSVAVVYLLCDCVLYSVCYILGCMWVWPSVHKSTMTLLQGYYYDIVYQKPTFSGNGNVSSYH